MSAYENVYYTPEKFGLTLVGEVELFEPNYSFDLAVLWRDANGAFAWAFDSGCSCPSPFEETTLDDITRGTLPEFQAAVEEAMGVDGYGKAQLVDLLIRASS